MTDLTKEHLASLEEMLFSRDKFHREEAVNTLAQSDGTPAIRLLLKGVKSPSSATRQQIAGVLRDKEHPMIVPGLIAMLDAEEFHVRKSAADILQGLPPERVAPEIRKLAADPQLDAALRVELIPLLARSDDAELEPMFREYIQGDDEAVKHAAIEGLCRSDAGWTITLLLELMEARDPDVRKRVTDALVKRHSPVLIDRLIEMLRSPGDSGIQAVVVLSRIADADIIGRVAELLKADNGDVRRQALMLIKALDPERAADYAFNMLHDAEDANRDMAEDILQTVPPGKLVQQIKTVFPGESPGFMESAARLLFRSNLPDALALVETAFDGLSTKLKRAVIRGAGDVQSETAIRFLKSNAGDVTTGTQAVRALGDISDMTATQALVDLMSVPELSDTARMELEGNAGPELESLMLTIVEQQSGDTVKSALKLLGRIGSGRALKKLLDMPVDFPFRDALCGAIGEIELRREITAGGGDVTEMDLMDIENRATGNGWTAPADPLAMVLRESGRIRYLSRLRDVLRKEQRKLESAVNSLERKIERIETFLAGSSRSMSTRLIYLFMTVLFGGAAGYSFYRNWQPKAPSYWYGLFAVSTVIAGLFAFLFYRYKGPKGSKSVSLNIANPRETLVEYRETLAKHREDLAPVEKQLGEVTADLEKRDATAIAGTLENLIRTLTGPAGEH